MTTSCSVSPSLSTTSPPIFSYHDGKRFRAPLKEWKCRGGHNSNCKQSTYIWPKCLYHGLQEHCLRIGTSTIGPFKGLFAYNPYFTLDQKKFYHSASYPIVVFRKGDYITDYIGEIIGAREYYRRYNVMKNKDEAQGPYTVDYDEPISIDNTSFSSSSSHTESSSILEEQNNNNNNINNNKIQTRKLRKAIDGALWRSYACFINSPLSGLEKDSNVTLEFASPLERKSYSSSYPSGNAKYLKVRATKTIYDGDEILWWYGEAFFPPPSSSSSSSSSSSLNSDITMDNSNINENKSNNNIIVGEQISHHTDWGDYLDYSKQNIKLNLISD